VSARCAGLGSGNAGSVQAPRGLERFFDRSDPPGGAVQADSNITDFGFINSPAAAPPETDRRARLCARSRDHCRRKMPCFDIGSLVSLLWGLRPWPL